MPYLCSDLTTMLKITNGYGFFFICRRRKISLSLNLIGRMHLLERAEHFLMKSEI